MSAPGSYRDARSVVEPRPAWLAACRIQPASLRWAKQLPPPAVMTPVTKIRWLERARTVSRKSPIHCPPRWAADYDTCGHQDLKRKGRKDTAENRSDRQDALGVSDAMIKAYDKSVPNVKPSVPD